MSTYNLGPSEIIMSQKYLAIKLPDSYVVLHNPLVKEVRLETVGPYQAREAVITVRYSEGEITNELPKENIEELLDKIVKMQEENRGKRTLKD